MSTYTIAQELRKLTDKPFKFKAEALQDPLDTPITTHKVGPAVLKVGPARDRDEDESLELHSRSGVTEVHRLYTKAQGKKWLLQAGKYNVKITAVGNLAEGTSSDPDMMVQEVTIEGVTAQHRFERV